MTYNIKIFGIVQGVGFRPFISRLANDFFILGTVANKGSYVEIFAQSSKINLKNFVAEIPKKSPPRSAILKIDVTEIFSEKIYKTFEIIDSEHEAGDIFVSPDIAICEKCAAELFDKNNIEFAEGLDFEDHKVIFGALFHAKRIFFIREKLYVYRFFVFLLQAGCKVHLYQARPK